MCKFIDPPARDLKDEHMFAAAIEVEYEVFSSSKVTNMILYRRQMAKTVLELFILNNSHLLSQNSSSSRKLRN